MATGTTIPLAPEKARPMTAEERKVIFASSAGTVFEWYDFYLSGSLAANIAAKFFSGVNPTARLHLRAARLRRRLRGASVRRAVLRPPRRPHRPQVHLPRHHDRHGHRDLRRRPAARLRQHRHMRRPILFIACRLLQGLALGGEYGGAATYVAEHAPQGRRGFYTSWIQTTATVGLFLSLLVILALAPEHDAGGLRRLGLARPVPVSILLLGGLDLDPAAARRIAGLHRR